MKTLVIALLLMAQNVLAGECTVTIDDMVKQYNCKVVVHKSNITAKDICSQLLNDQAQASTYYLSLKFDDPLRGHYWEEYWTLDKVYKKYCTGKPE